MANYKDNPWELAYDNAVTLNIDGLVNIHPVTYISNGVKVAANLYTPIGYDETADKQYAAVAVAHPNGGTKEQVAGAYAQILAENGYIAIAADAAYQGASEGAPHFTDRPAYRIEDIRRMGDYLATVPGVDPERIGVFGICGGGGYTLGAAQSDASFKAVATLSMFNSGRVRRNGLGDADTATVAERLADANAARVKEAETGEVEIVGGMPAGMTQEQIDAYTEQMRTQPHSLYRDGYFYYGIDYFHPRATGQYTKSSLVDLMMWDAEDRMDMIHQPLLMMAGSEADTLYMTEDAFAKATGTDDKELFLINGASHIQTYFIPAYVQQVAEKLIGFFGRTL